MLSGLSSAATAIDVYEQQQLLIARNLSHVNTPGYRREFMVLEEISTNAEPNGMDPGEGVVPAQVVRDFTPGAMEKTDNPLDIAIEGDGFFVLDGPEGELYTRHGDFAIGENGAIVSDNGLALLGLEGSIQLPVQASVYDMQISRDGAVIV